jgi:hypothetical protein
MIMITILMILIPPFLQHRYQQNNLYSERSKQLLLQICKPDTRGVSNVTVTFKHDHITLRNKSV